MAMKRWSLPEEFIDFKQKDVEIASKGNGKKEREREFLLWGCCFNPKCYEVT